MMTSLSIVGCGKENIQNFMDFLQAELKAFMQQNHAHLYNLKTLWKAESSPELLKKSNRLILPANKDTSNEYWGFFNVDDWDALYSKLFSSAETVEFNHPQNEYYSFSRLKSLLRQFAISSAESTPDNAPYDFKIEYDCEMLHNSDRICIIKIEIGTAYAEAENFFYHMVSTLDNLFPDMFLSAYVDNSYSQVFGIKFDIEMLTKYIVNTGYAFYISEKLSPIGKADAGILPQYNASCMKNGTWWKLQNPRKRANIPASNWLIPQYTVVNWSDLIRQKHLRIDDFDTVSVYYDKYSPADPHLIFSRGYTPAQIDSLAKEHGDVTLQVQCALNYLLADLSL